MDLFGAPATNPGFTAAGFSSGGRGVPPRRGSGGVEALDLDLHLGLPYGERLSSASAGAVGEADFAGGRRGAAPSRAASAARAAMATRTGWGGAPAGTAARPYRSPRPANAVPTAAGGPPVGGRGGVGGGAGVAAGGQYADDGALSQESQGHAEWRKLKNGPPKCLDNLEVMFEHIAADASSCVLGKHISNDSDDGGDESEDWGEESDDDGDYESDEDGGDESDDDGDYESDDDGGDESDEEGDDGSDDDGGDESDDGGDESHINSPNLKRGRNTSTSAYSPRKRERREMVKLMKRLLDTLQAGNNQEANTLVQISRKKVEQKKMEQQEMDQEIYSCLSMAKDCGATEDTEEYYMATKLFEEKYNRTVFLNFFTTNEGRLGWLKWWCRDWCQG